MTKKNKQNKNLQSKRGFTLLNLEKREFRKKRNYLTGFTLVEMLVAIGIFAVVMTMTAAAFLNITDLQAKTESFRKVNDNLNFAMEAMMREIREGYNYKCATGGDCVDEEPSQIISFKWLDLDIANGNKEKTISYEKKTSDDNVYSYINRTFDGAESRITSDSVNIENLKFTVNGVGTGDEKQPLVTISLTAKAGKGKTEKTKSSLNIQTTVSQRKLDTGYEY